MVRLFVLFPSLASPHRDRCAIIAVNVAGDAEKSERVDLLFLFLNSVISPIFWGVATVLPLSVLVPALVEPLSPQPRFLFWLELSVIPYSMTLA